MEDDNIIIRAKFLEREDTVACGLLNGRAAVDNQFEFRDVVLAGIGAQNVLPAVQTNDNDAVNFGVPLKIFQRVNDYRLVVNVDELLRDVLTGALSFARGQKQCISTHKKFAAKISAARHLHEKIL